MLRPVPIVFVYSTCLQLTLFSVYILLLLLVVYNTFTTHQASSDRISRLNGSRIRRLKSGMSYNRRGQPLDHRSPTTLHHLPPPPSKLPRARVKGAKGTGKRGQPSLRGPKLTRSSREGDSSRFEELRHLARRCTRRGPSQQVGVCSRWTGDDPREEPPSHFWRGWTLSRAFSWTRVEAGEGPS